MIEDWMYNSAEYPEECFGHMLFETFWNEVMGDEEPCDKIGYNIMSEYECADQEDKELIDSVFINLCGWSVPTLIEMTKENMGK